jgi:hypothetical protein
MKCSNPECSNDIPAQALAKHSGQKFCCRECSIIVNNDRLKQAGYYQKFSQAGNEAQSAYKEAHGVVPGYENRVKALKRPDHHSRKNA